MRQTKYNNMSSSSKKASSSSGRGDDSSSSWDRKNATDEKNFLKMYSKALAEALRTKEEEEAAEREYFKKPRNKTLSGNNRDTIDHTKIQSAYRELCHDDPIVTGGDRICCQLAECLTPSYRKSSITKLGNKNDDENKKLLLALSSPLVEGIMQAVERAGSKSNNITASSSTKEDAAKSDDISESSQNQQQRQQQESMIGSSSITTSEGYAQLAFTIFLEGPYRCIQQADDIDVSYQFLGSFKPLQKTNNDHATSLNAEEKSKLVEEATAKIVQGIEKLAMEEDREKAVASSDAKRNNIRDDASSSSSEFFLHNNNNNSNMQISQYGDNDSMEEIFADESDPDDYEYESSFNPYNAASNDNVDDNNIYDDYEGYYFNPTQLSEPTSKSPSEARKSIYYLLSSFSYANMALSTISSRVWNDFAMSESLADLAFTLLLAHTNGCHDINSLLWQDKIATMDEDDVNDDITTLWDRPLFALRDRAMDNNRGHDALPVYLQLICAFLSHSEEDVMSILSSPSKETKNTSDDIPPLTAVGLSSFATLCSSKEMTCSSSAKLCGTSVESICPRDEVKNAILNSIDTLGHIIERVRPKKSTFGGNNTLSSEDKPSSESWVRTAVCIVPMIEYLVNVQARFDFQTVFEGGGSRIATMSDSDAKALLDSGLFREILLLYTCTQTETADTANVVRLQLLRTVFAMAVQAPEVLGRFATRMPDLVKEVHAADFMKEHLVDGILWTALGSSLLESKVEANPQPRLKLRTNTKLTLPPVDTSTLAERCNLGFERLCKSTNTALIKLKDIVDSENEDDENEVKKHKECLGDIVKFSNYLSNCPHGIKIWLDSLYNNEDAPRKANASIAELRSTLARLPSYTDKTEVSKPDHKKDDDNDNIGAESDNDIRQKTTSLRQRRKEFGKVVSLVRSSVKVIALALESRKGAGLSLKTVSYNASSKTD